MNKRSVFALIIILPLCLLSGAYLISKPWISLRHVEPVSVKGYAEIDIEADSGVLIAKVTHTGASLGEAYEACGKDLETVRLLTLSQFSSAAKVTELETSISEITKLDEQGRRTNYIDFYSVSRRLRIESNDVQSIEKLSRSIYDLNSKGIRASVEGPSYFVSNLDDIKLELVKQATINGYERAEIMANNSNAKLGNLVSARQGVIQITKRNSAETSDWGMYDTGTIEKSAKLAVTLEYEIR